MHILSGKENVSLLDSGSQGGDDEADKKSKDDQVRSPLSSTALT